MAFHEIVEEDIPCPTCEGRGTIKRKVRRDFTPEEEVVIKDAIAKMPPKETNEP